MRLAAYIGIALLFFSSCNDEPVFPETPAIEFVSITPDEPTQFSVDEMKLVIRYQDGDGNIGYLEGSGAPATNLFLKDVRDVIPHDSLRTLSFSIPDLTPDTRKPSIQGEIEITLTTPPHFSFIDPNAQEEPLVFEVWLMDRAGNSSNVIRTDPVTIQP